MIHPERHTRHEPFRDYVIRDKLCREIEREYGLTVDNGREQRRDNALTHKAATIEAQTGQESFESYAKRHKDKILEALAHAKDWQGLHEALKACGLGIKPHGNGLVITDLHGNHAAKASTVDRSLSAKRLQEKFGEFQTYRSLRQIEEISRYQAVPLHRSPERGELYAKYKKGIEARKGTLEAIKEREDQQLAAIRQKWEGERRKIEKMSIGKRNRLNLLTLAKKHEKEAIAKAKLALRPQREAVRQEIPYTSWTAFLQHEAEQGNETALAVLRSRKEDVEPEQAPGKPAPTKSWLERGNAYSATLAVKAEYAEKERALQERHDITASGKKQLQAFLRMEQLVEEASAKGQNLGKIKYRVDGKGIVLFSLASGGSIRDTGKEIFYSGHGQKAQEIAALYAAKKWGKNVLLEKGRITFQLEHEVQRPTPELHPRKKGISR